MFQFPGRTIAPQPAVGTTLASPAPQAMPIAPVAAPMPQAMPQHNAVMPAPMPVTGQAPINPIAGIIRAMSNLQHGIKPGPADPSRMANFRARHPHWPGAI